jgi:hypothetical protein
MCDNAPEGVSPDRDRRDALQGDCFEHFFSISVWEANLLHYRAVLTGSEALQRCSRARVRPRSTPSAA